MCLYVLLVNSVAANMKVKIKRALFLCEENLQKELRKTETRTR